ncbi:MAG: thioesterase family protein [Candidatus Kapabacteria bacterium]|nr:thioesterase family protein [Candidatus Kapabacteria bacterium]
MFEDKIIITNDATVRVIYADTDKMGVVNNGRYFNYFEVGRTELMRKAGLAYADVEKFGFFLPLTEAHARFILTADYDDLLTIQTSLKLEYKATITFEYNIFRDQSLICKGYTVHSFLSNQTRKAVRPPKIFFETVNDFYQKNNEKMA